MSHDDARVFVFARTWSMDALDPEAIRDLLAQIDALGVELVVLCRTGVWSLRPGDTDLRRQTDRLAGDAPTTVTLYAASRGGDGVYVIDAGGRVVRVGSGAPRGLAIALDGAHEVIVRRRAVLRAARALAAAESVATAPRRDARPAPDPAPAVHGSHP